VECLFSMTPLPGATGARGATSPAPPRGAGQPPQSVLVSRPAHTRSVYWLCARVALTNVSTQLGLGTIVTET